MGLYLNPGNSGFEEILQTRYVDKTGMIRLINDTIGTKQKLTCVSRARRFGKSYAAQMLCAYYGKGCDSAPLFAGLEIERSADYKKHLNRYDVIYLDMTTLLGKTEPAGLVAYIAEKIAQDIEKAYPDVTIEDAFDQTLLNLVEYTGDKLVMIVDEWDAPIRETPQITENYLKFLRMLFKGSGTTSKIFAAAYMTGILPIKKDGSQSAISDFEEYTMLKPRQYGRYVGFTEAEVLTLCEECGISFDEMKKWYDGYRFQAVGSVYNPNSVMKAIRFHDFDSYWTETSAAEGLLDYIGKDYNGLTRTVAELIGGVDVPIDTNGFSNDLRTFRGKDDVLTLLAHFGYLAYDADSGTVRIPNEEIRREFSRAVRVTEHTMTLRRVAQSDQLFSDTLRKREEAVAAQIEKIHAEETSPLHYNREESLRSVIKLAYYTYADHYLQWEELPAGVGYADVVYLPKHDSGWPALVIELKWNKSAKGAIDQILKKDYPSALRGLDCPILLVGVNYDRDAPAGERKHTCRIVEV